MKSARRNHRMVAVSATIALLAGCQSPSALLPGMRMQVDALGSPVSPQPAAAAPVPAPAAPVEVAVASAPAAPITAPAAVSSGGGGSSGPNTVAPAPVPVGALSVDLAGVAQSLPQAAQRRVLATVVDVDRLIVTVAQAGQPDRVTEVTAAEMQAGKTSVAFDNLPTGTCTVTIVAKDASGTVIGTSSRAAAIAQAADTTFAVRVMIVPDDGSGLTYTNSLVFGLELTAAPAAQAPDGSGPVSGTVAATFPIGMTWGFVADGRGSVFAQVPMGGGGNNIISGIVRLSSADGSRLGAIPTHQGNSIRPVGAFGNDPVHGTVLLGLPTASVQADVFGDGSVRAIASVYGLSPIRVNSAGDAFYFSKNGIIERLSAGGASATTVPARTAFDIDTTDRLWVNVGNAPGMAPSILNGVACYHADGTKVGSYPLPFPAVRIASDGAGGVWVGDRPGGQVVHVGADGTVGAPLGVTATAFCVDAQRNLWIANGPMLLKLAPDGTELGNFPIKANHLATGDGHVFAGTSVGILKIQL
ncbi:hypothetical protein D3C72_772460 [compost metagenome]